MSEVTNSNISDTVSAIKEDAVEMVEEITNLEESEDCMSENYGKVFSMESEEFVNLGELVTSMMQTLTKMSTDSNWRESSDIMTLKKQCDEMKGYVDEITSENTQQETNDNQNESYKGAYFYMATDAAQKATLKYGQDGEYSYEEPKGTQKVTSTNSKVAIQNQDYTR